MSFPPSLLEPGMIVENPARPDWGQGQVQSRVGTIVTVNFEHEGKLTVDAAVITLIPAADS
ncbi:MAG: DUF3553 domain-containing protein [Rhodobacteraceae bacterium]|nr:DUF3553 domain-containing protein [Paracoccaceae bacterium]